MRVSNSTLCCAGPYRAGEDMRHERHFMYSLFGYMVKDMFIFINDPMFFAHHAICIVGMLCIFAVPAGLGTFILGGGWGWSIDLYLYVTRHHFFFLFFFSFPFFEDTFPPKIIILCHSTPVCGSLTRSGRHSEQPPTLIVTQHTRTHARTHAHTQRLRRDHPP